MMCTDMQKINLPLGAGDCTVMPDHVLHVPQIPSGRGHDYVLRNHASSRFSSVDPSMNRSTRTLPTRYYAAISSEME